MGVKPWLRILSIFHKTTICVSFDAGFRYNYTSAHSQVETFKNMVDISGLVMTKLDGSARGGVVVGLAEKFGLPVHAIGVGEGIDDFRPFDARDFSRALMGLDT